MNDIKMLSQCATNDRWCCGELTSKTCCTWKNRFFFAVIVDAFNLFSKFFIEFTSFIVDRKMNSQFIFSSDLTFISFSILIIMSTSTSTFSISHFQSEKFADIDAETEVEIFAIDIFVLWLIVRRQSRDRTNDENQYQRPVVQELATAGVRNTEIWIKRNTLDTV